MSNFMRQRLLYISISIISYFLYVSCSAEYDDLLKESRIQECEEKKGKTLVQDFYVSNKISCYWDKVVMDGYYMAAVHLPNPAEALLSACQHRKEIVVIDYPIAEIRNKVIYLLLKYYSFLEISKYKGFEKLTKEEIVHLKEGESLPYAEYVKVKNGRLKYPQWASSSGRKYTIKKWLPFEIVSKNGTPTFLYGFEANREPGDGFVYIKNVKSTKEGLSITIVKIE